MLDPDDYIIPVDALILVTGANGYIASHVISVLLQLGFRVRGTVRAAKPWLDEYFESNFGPGRYESVVVPRLETTDALARHLPGVSGLIHVASNMSGSANPHSVIPEVLLSTQNILKTAKTVKTLKRVVVTSSMIAAGYPELNKEGLVFDEDSWNFEAVQQAWQSAPRVRKSLAIYAASKVESERGAWNWANQNRPHFSLNTVLPNVNFGTILHPNIRGSSMAMTRRLLKGDKVPMMALSPQWFIDVEDNAWIHAGALLHPDVEFERIFAVAEPFNWTDVVGVLRKLRPDNDKIPNPPENEGRDLSEISPAKRAADVLQAFAGRKLRSLEDSLSNGIQGC